MSEIIEIKEELAKITKLLQERENALENKEVLALEKIADEIKKDIFEAHAKSGAKKQKRLLHKMSLRKGIAYQELFVDTKGEVVKYGGVFFYESDPVLSGGGRRDSAGFSRVALPHDIEFVEIFGGFYNFMALPKEGNFLYVWGKNTQGCLGLGHANPTKIPVRVETPARVVSIVGGGSEAGSCGFTLLMENGKVYSTGENTRGEGGTGSALPLMNITEVISIKDIVHIARARATCASVCAIDKEGGLFVWGFNAQGCLGLGHTDNVKTPTRLVLNKKVKKAFPVVYPYSEYWAATFLLLEDDTLLGAGYGAHGSLSQNNLNHSTLFIPIRDSENIPLQGIKEVYGASTYMPCLALSKEGALYSWGYGVSYGYGDERTENYARAKKIDEEVMKVACLREQYYHVTYQKSDGKLKSFGYGACFALGDGDNEKQPRALSIVLPSEIKDFLIGGANGDSFLLASDGEELYASGKQGALPFSSATLQKQ